MNPYRWACSDNALLRHAAKKNAIARIARTPTLKTKAARMGKIVRVAGREIIYYSVQARALTRLDNERAITAPIAPASPARIRLLAALSKYLPHPTPRAKPRANFPPRVRWVDAARQTLGPRHTIVPRAQNHFAYLANVRRTLTRQSSSRIERGFICQRFMQTLARALGIKLRTVEQHVTSILKKLELESRHKAAEWARENRVFENLCARIVENSGNPL